MVEVFKKGNEKPIEIGEVIFEDETTFKLHSSYEIFDKNTHHYKTKL